MNIDAHVHLVGDGWIHEDFLLNMARVAAAGAGKASGEPPDAAMLVEVIRGGLMDTTGEKLVAEMDSRRSGSFLYFSGGLRAADGRTGCFDCRAKPSCC